MMSLETLNMIVALVVGVSTVVSMIALGIRWLTKHYFDEIKKELKPNSGSSLKDQVTRLEQQHEKLESKLDDLYDKFITYLANSESTKTTRNKKN